MKQCIANKTILLRWRETVPIFEYKCQKCGEEFEELVSGQNPDVACPKCNSRKIRKKFSVFGMSGAGNSGAGCSTCTSTSCKSCH